MKPPAIRTVATLLLGLCAWLPAAFGQSTPAAPDPNRVWIKFKPGNQGYTQSLVQAAGGRIHHVFDHLDAVAATIPPQALDAIRRNPAVAYVEPDALRHPSAEVAPYGIAMVQAPEVWSQSVTGSGAKVCIIDSGIQANHPDLAGVAMTGSATTNASGAVMPWNTDTCGHGTHVAGTIAAIRNNNTGVVGVNPGSIALHIVKVFDGSSCGWAYSSSLVAAANMCKAAGAKIINMSLGGSSASATEQAAFDYLYNADGILSIAAAGNDGSTRFSYPASYDSVVSVAAVDSAGVVAGFSQKNSQVELAAPGVGVLSTVPVAPLTTIGTESFIVSQIDGAAKAIVTGKSLVNGADCSVASTAYSGKIVLCVRGNISFNQKVVNVKAGGGLAAIIYNNAPGPFSGTLGTNVTSTIPAVAMSGDDGATALGLLDKTATVNTSTGGPGYDYWDGTSMATPHVSGVAALVWSANYTGANAWTNKQVRAAMQSTAKDMGTIGRDSSYGFGIVQAKDALARLNGEAATTPTAVVSTLSASSKTTVKTGTTVATAVATMRTDAGPLLVGAAVTGCFNGGALGCSTLTTNTNGQATYKSTTYRKSGTPVRFCVSAVSGYNFAASSTSNCIDIN